ncbi:hypothetical protein MPH_00109 [Macrophomina phaseolina MS6]|uniref:Uncharacterized protein n=1 Tax=Macrophomina phaseolina (strain MS6) TaxID=1126212 RepID=K2RJ24_MACPH|nr:hypothetical protein MPH_00109 [Macrophomina phaseolina MS6]
MGPRVSSLDGDGSPNERRLHWRRPIDRPSGASGTVQSRQARRRPDLGAHPQDRMFPRPGIRQARPSHRRSHPNRVRRWFHRRRLSTVAQGLRSYHN